MCVSFERSIVCTEMSKYVPDRDWPTNRDYPRSRTHWLSLCTKRRQWMPSKDLVPRELGGPRGHYEIVCGFCYCAHYQRKSDSIPDCLHLQGVPIINACTTYFVESALCRVEIENFLPEKLMILVGLGDPSLKP